MTPALFGFLLATAILSAIATGGVLRLLRRQSIYDQPTDRSSHTVPTPRGAGLAVVPVLLLSWWASGLVGIAAPSQLAFLVACGGAIILAAVSWRDDLVGLPVAVRLPVHLVVAGAAVAAAPTLMASLSGTLPGWVNWLAATLILVWFLNLFNFMDGIDGLAGTEALVVGVGCAVVSWANGDHAWIGTYGLLMSAVCIGFLIWNWNPARLFLGDVGSIPLGFLLGWLLLHLAAEGSWAAAIILPMYYLADSGVTLARRALRGAPVWKAHREHFYQHATQRIASHARVTLMIGVFNLLLVGLALVSVNRPWSAILAAIALTIVFLMFLGRPASKSAQK